MDPWGEKNHKENKEKGKSLSFESDFSERNHDNETNETRLMNDDYSVKLEEKLKRMQTKKTNNISSKDMLNTLKTQRESSMNNLLLSNHQQPMEYSNMGPESPTFLENLYQTNSFYRHMNPQQALETVEKLPIVYHDHLSLENTSENSSSAIEKEGGKSCNINQ